MNGRVEDSITGRMLSADPHVPDRSNPQSYNRYTYVNNNPLTATDPSGFCSPAWACKQDAGSGLGQCRVCGGSDPGDAGVLAAEEATGDQLAGTDESDASISDSTVPGQPGYAAYQAQLQAGIYAALGYPGVYTGNATSDPSASSNASSDSAPADNSSSTDVSSSNLAAMAQGLNAAADAALADLSLGADTASSNSTASVHGLAVTGALGVLASGSTWVGLELAAKLTIGVTLGVTPFLTGNPWGANSSPQNAANDAGWSGIGAMANLGTAEFIGTAAADLGAAGIGLGISFLGGVELGREFNETWTYVSGGQSSPGTFIYNTFHPNQ